MKTNVRKTLPTILTAAAILVSGLVFIPQASAGEGQCNNSGVQIVVGDYDCMAQYCDNRSGAGAGAGAGGPGQNDAKAGATAGTECTQGDNTGDKQTCEPQPSFAPRLAVPQVPDVPEDDEVPNVGEVIHESTGNLITVTCPG